MKIFWIERSMVKTPSVVETGTRKISKPPSSWRYLVCTLLNNRYKTQQMALTLEKLEEKYPQADWTHVYTDGSREDLLEMEEMACLSGPQQDKQLAENAQISKQKPQHSKMQ